MSTREMIDLVDKYSAHNYKPLEVVLTKGEGVWVWDVEGNKYLDCLSAYSAVSHGHAHPRIVNALTDQAAKLGVTSRAFHNDCFGPWCKKMVDTTGMEMVLPMNTGAEAVETAVKIARKWGYKVKGVPKYKAKIITCENNFHGRTITVISFSTDELYKEAFGPFTPGFETIPYGDAEALEAAMDENVVAFLVEPIQGEAGVIVPPAGYLKKARELCDKHNVLLMADEIQTGLGRTGKWFACDHEGVKPDVYILGKALGGGILPISAVASSKEVLGLFVPGEHGSTFGGMPLACRVSSEALDILNDENLVEKSAKMGAKLKAALQAIKNDQIKEVRGEGLLLAVEMKPGGMTARQICEKLQEKGLLCKETHETTVRFAPPLVITDEQIDWAMEQIKGVLTEA
jgi:ornithine--oxo-acid transaminase